MNRSTDIRVLLRMFLIMLMLTTLSACATPPPAPVATLPAVPSTPNLVPTDPPAVPPAMARPPQLCLTRGAFPPLLANLRYGINAFLLTANQDRITRLVQMGGYGWVRQQIHWRDIETRPGVYDWNPLDQVVDHLQEAGVDLLVSIVRSPRWETANSVGGLPEHPAGFARFVHALATRYHGRIGAYEIWNEPNLAVENGGQAATPAHYLTVLQAAYPAIKQADPCALVLAAPLASTNTNDPAIGVDDLNFYQQLYSLDHGAFLKAADMLALHPGGGDHAFDQRWPDKAPQQSRSYFRHLEEVRALMQQAGDQRQAWITEVGWAIQAATGGPPAVSVQEQADNLVGALRYTHANYPWVTAIFVWNLNFAVTGASDDEKSAFGILAHDWSPRSAYLAIQAYLQQQAADQRQRIPDLQGIPYTFDWLVVTEGKVHTPPTIGPDGTIYVGSDLGRFYAISPSGGLRWIYHAAGGTRTAPAIQADGTLYVGDEHGSLTALRPDGQMIWQRDLGGSIRGTPQITGNALFVVTADGFATRLDLAGKTIWRTALGAAGAPAILRDDILYAATADGHVVAITSDGHIRWRAMLGHPIASGPTINAITPDPVLLIGDFDGYLTSLRLRDGQMIWQHKLAERIASPTISSASPLIAAPPLVGNDGMIYVGGRDGVLTAVDPAGTIHWRYLSGSDISATPMLGHDGLLYVGLYDQRLITLDHDGKPHWQAHVSGAVRTTPRYGSDDTLYVVTIGGVVYALTPQSVVQSTRMAAGL